MNLLLKFIKLTPCDRHLLMKTLFLLISIRLGLRVLPFQTLRHLLAEASRLPVRLQNLEETSIDKVVWAVYVASHYVRGAKCLSQALATQTLLQRRGYPCELRIGLARENNGQMSAHAWTESQGKVVIGGAGKMAHYIPIPILELGSKQKQHWFLLS